MTTIGDLTLNDIGKTRISLGTGDGRVEGTIGWIGTDVDRTEYRGGAGTVLYRTRYDVTVSLTLGDITVEGLDRNHPCEVIA